MSGRITTTLAPAFARSTSRRAAQAAAPDDGPTRSPSSRQSAKMRAAGSELVQLVQTKEVAACWTAHDDGEVCVANPGSMTVSCGHIGPGGFSSYTSAAANPVGDGVFDLSLRKGLVGIMATKDGAAILLVYVRADDDSDNSHGYQRDLRRWLYVLRVWRKARRTRSRQQ